MAMRCVFVLSRIGLCCRQRQGRREFLLKNNVNLLGVCMPSASYGGERNPVVCCFPQTVSFAGSTSMRVDQYQYRA